MGVRTTKPISTISYNTEPFFVERLNALMKAKKVEFWAYIPHLGEDDEVGLKPHIHAYIEPARMLQTVELQELFREFDPSMPDKPLGVQLFRSSKFADWYLYTMHDVDYLRSKGLVRKYHYSADDFRTSSADDLYRMTKEIDFHKMTPYADMRQAIADGKSFVEYIELAGVAPALYMPYRTAWEDFAYRRERDEQRRYDEESRERMIETQNAYRDASEKRDS